MQTRCRVALKLKKRKAWLLIEEQAGIVQSGFLLEKSQRQQFNLATQLRYEIFEKFLNIFEIFYFNSSKSLFVFSVLFKKRNRNLNGNLSLLHTLYIFRVIHSE